MPRPFANDPAQMALPERNQEIQTFAAYSPDQAFAKGVTFGDRTGDLSTRKPELLSIASTCAEKMASRSWSTNLQGWVEGVEGQCSAGTMQR